MASSSRSKGNCKRRLRRSRRRSTRASSMHRHITTGSQGGWTRWWILLIAFHSNVVYNLFRAQAYRLLGDLDNAMADLTKAINYGQGDSKILRQVSFDKSGIFFFNGMVSFTLSPSRILSVLPNTITTHYTPRRTRSAPSFAAIPATSRAHWRILSVAPATATLWLKQWR